MTRASRSWVIALLAGAFCARDAAADTLALPWGDAAAAIPRWVASARVQRADLPLLMAPSPSAGRRGSANLGVGLPIFAARYGEGCAGKWLELGAEAWACDDALELSGNPAIDALSRSKHDATDGLPFRYFFVGPDGSFGYKRLDAVDVGEPDMQLEPGFAVAVVEERLVDGARYGRSNNGLWIPLRDVGPARGFPFHGEEIPKDAAVVPVAWVLAEKAKVHKKPSPLSPSAEARSRFDVVPFLEESSGFSGKFTRIGADAWIASSELRHATIAPPPAEVDVAAGERWIDVELATQTLVAYEGARPVFATLVSSGKGRGTASDATPVGVHRVWVKLLSTNMDNLEDDNANRYYRMEDVPWVQFFSKGFGLHGAYWHRSFGRVRSHGCVNLAPLDAQRLFWWTGPHLPAGWSAVLPTSHELGTVVRVR